MSAEQPEDEFTRAFRLHWGRFVGSAQAALGSRDEAEDAVSAAFARAYERRATFDAGRGSLAGWLAVIVRNEVTDRLRGRTRRPASPLAPGDEIASDEDVAATVERAETQARLMDALARLPDRDRQLIGWRFGHGLTNREIARRMGADERVVSVWMLRAMRRLKPLMEEP